jgi:hypothetical protein
MRDNITEFFLIIFFSHRVHTCLLSQKMFSSQKVIISFGTTAIEPTCILILKLHKKGKKKYFHISDAEASQCEPSIHREGLKKV